MSDEKPFLKPEKYVVTDKDGVERTFILSSFDAVTGREIITQYPLSALPKIGDYALNKDLLNKLMSHVGVEIGEKIIRLETDALINNHCGDWETLAKIELAMMTKNSSFFSDGRSWDFLEIMAQMFARKLAETLTLSSAQSSATEEQPSTN